MSFMIVGYPWPIPSAHVELTGRNRKATRPHQTAGTAAASQQPVTDAEQQDLILTAAKA